MNTWTRLLCLSLVIWHSRPGIGATNQGSEAPQGAVHVFHEGPSISAPEPIPSVKPIVVPDNCKGKTKGTIRLLVIVDALGMPQNISLLQPLGTDLDKLAMLYLDAERFKPGIRNGEPVAISQGVAMQIVACSVDGPKQNQKRTHTLHLQSLPTQNFFATDTVPNDVVFGPTVRQNMAAEFNEDTLYKVVGNQHQAGLKEPKLIKYVDPLYSDEALSKRITGTVVISLVVDSNGIPHKLSVVRSLGYGLDEQAVAAVSSYRFSPALHADSPVAVAISVQVNFLLN